MNLLDDIISERHQSLVIAIALPFILGIGYIDYFFGSGVSLAQGYILAILVITWAAGRWPGLAVSLVSLIVETGGDFLRDGGGLLPGQLWGLSGHLFFYVLIVLMTAALRRSRDQERDNARIDFLTGIANSRGFIESAGVELERARRSGYPLTVVYMDLDNFKMVNDTSGHMIGDSLLRRVAMIIRNNTRVSDLSARMGGDEFALLLPGIRREQAKLAMSKLTVLLTGEMKKNGWPVTFSIGCITFEKTDRTIEEMLKDADESMYGVKRQGKNNIAFGVHEN